MPIVSTPHSDTTLSLERYISYDNRDGAGESYHDFFLTNTNELDSKTTSCAVCHLPIPSHNALSKHLGLKNHQYPWWNLILWIFAEISLFIVSPGKGNTSIRLWLSLESQVSLWSWYIQPRVRALFLHLCDKHWEDSHCVPIKNCMRATRLEAMEYQQARDEIDMRIISRQNKTESFEGSKVWAHEVGKAEKGGTWIWVLGWWVVVMKKIFIVGLWSAESPSGGGPAWGNLCNLSLIWFMYLHMLYRNILFLSGGVASILG